MGNMEAKSYSTIRLTYLRLHNMGCFLGAIRSSFVRSQIIFLDFNVSGFDANAINVCF